MHNPGNESKKNKLFVVGIGPGDPAQMTPRAMEAVAMSGVVAGYSLYLELIRPLLQGKRLITSAMKGEVQRCSAAVEEALSGNTVSVVSSGDAGVYGMASLILELAAEHPRLEVEVIPGVTAATAAAGILGAPLSHDFAVISLSDLLTPWPLIEKRLMLSAQADLVICLYNPSSKKRRRHLATACGLLLKHRDEATVCGLVRSAGREGQSHQVLTLRELAESRADMFTTVIIGNSQTKIINGRMVTPRGYMAL